MRRNIQLFQVVLTIIVLSNYCYSQNIAKPRIEYITKFDPTIKAERNVGIRFVNGRGATIKTMSLNNILVNETKDYIVHRQYRYLKKSQNSGYTSKSIKLINALGKIKWQKTFKSYTVYLPDPPYDYNWNEGIASSSGIYFIMYRDSLEKYFIDIIDTTGSYLMQIKHDRPFAGIEIAGDGKLLVAKTGYYEYEVYFVFDITTQRSQIIRGSIEYQNTSFTISPRNNKELNIFGDIYEFDKLPIGYFPFRMGKQE